jgi:hypothetical protein
MRFKVLVLITILSVINVSLADSISSKESSEALARKAISEDSAESTAAIFALRSRGAAGLEAFLDSHAAELKIHQLNLDRPVPQNTDGWRRLGAALDAICQQRDCLASRLYWNTDIEEAKRAAKASGKPILSLRLLGRLDEELSCANSRLFRITLYANAEVSRFLRERFILHWQSVRPVPKVTIDFGDGRKLERTLTGNSIHYILDAEGRAVDGLPGLYGPQAFLRELARAEQAEAICRAARTDEVRSTLLRRYHMARVRENTAEWASDIARLKISSPMSRDVPKPVVEKSNLPTAEVAIRAAITKMIVIERPVLRGISPEPKMLDPKAEDAAWARIGELHAEDARLDAASKALMRSKNASLYGAANDSAIDALERAARSLERAIAEDTARNEYIFHAKIHEWFAAGDMTTDVDKLNEKIYAELFLTPGSDPWLGLFPRDSYTAIENDGIRK